MSLVGDVIAYLGKRRVKCALIACAPRVAVTMALASVTASTAISRRRSHAPAV